MSFIERVKKLRPGTMALHDIRYYQKPSELTLFPLQMVWNKKLLRPSKHIYASSAETGVFQEASEAYVVSFGEDTNLCYSGQTCDNCVKRHPASMPHT
jgi:hypothetical protein